MPATVTYVRALVYTSDQASAKGELTQCRDSIRWQDVAGDTGTGSIFVGRDEPLLATASARPEIGDIIRFDVGASASGEPSTWTPAFAWQVESISYRHLGEEGRGIEGWQLKGRGTLSVWEKAVVWPPRDVGRALYSDIRVWNFASPELPEDDWVPVVANEHVFGEIFMLPELFPDDQAQWIWDLDQTAATAVAPSGDFYGRTTFDKDAYGWVECWALAQDAFELWVDGEQVAKDEGGNNGTPVRVKFALDAGEHKIAIRATKNVEGKAGVLATIMELDNDNVLGAGICRTDDTWICWPDPDIPPGFEAGRILRVLIDEFENQRGGPGILNTSCGDVIDTDGLSWPVLTEFAAPIGATYLDVIRKLSEVDIDVRMDPETLTLHAWVKGSAGTIVPSVTLDNATGDPDVDNLRTLTHEITNVGAVVP